MRILGCVERVDKNFNLGRIGTFIHPRAFRGESASDMADKMRLTRRDCERHAAQSCNKTYFQRSPSPTSARLTSDKREVDSSNLPVGPARRASSFDKYIVVTGSGAADGLPCPVRSIGRIQEQASASGGSSCFRLRGRSSTEKAAGVDAIIYIRPPFNAKSRELAWRLASPRRLPLTRCGEHLRPRCPEPGAT